MSQTEPPRECDIAVVGGGIVGMAVARELLLRKPGARLCVLEGEDAIGRHQTGRSSGVVHAGIYYQPGSLKARLCVEGSRALYEYCEEREIPFQRSGKLVVAVDETELGRLDELERRGAENPMVEIFKSTVYGALAGLVVGGAIALAAQGDDNTTSNIFRWSIVGGTVVGLGAGIYFVSKRPQPAALLELKDGALSLHPTPPQIEPGGGMSMRLVAVRF